VKNRRSGELLSGSTQTLESFLPFGPVTVPEISPPCFMTTLIFPVVCPALMRTSVGFFSGL
jgi:hypothetical protein